MTFVFWVPMILGQTFSWSVLCSHLKAFGHSWKQSFWTSWFHFAIWHADFRVVTLFTCFMAGSCCLVDNRVLQRCRLQCKPLEHVSCALPWSSSLLLAMQHGVHQSGLANQGSAVIFEQFHVMLVRHELGAFCTMLYFLDPGGHEFGSHHRLYGLVQAPWITIRHPQGIKDHQTHLNTIKQTIKQHQQQRPWKEQCQRKAKHCEYVWYRDLFKN